MSLSICIPTYNRSEILFTNVKSILNNKHVDLEIVISDNGSTDNTIELLESINDERLIIYTSSIGVNTQQNYIRALSLGTKNHLLFLTDKDKIDTILLDRLLEQLPHFKEYRVGITCSDTVGQVLPLEDISQEVQKGIFLSRHPSGYIFKKDFFDKIYPEYQNDYSINFPFTLDLIFSRFLLEKENKIFEFDKRIIIQESLRQTKKIKSYTYSPSKGNVYFLPENQIKTTKRYLKEISSFEKRIKQKALKEIVFRGLISSTIGFKKMIGNENIAEHYGIPVQKINLKQILSIYIEFWKKIYEEIPFTFLIIWFSVNKRILIKLWTISKRK